MVTLSVGGFKQGAVFDRLFMAAELTDYPPALRVKLLSVSDQLGKALALGSLESGVALVNRLFRRAG